MSDYIVRATAGNGSIRAFAATTRIWCSMQERFIIPLRCICGTGQNVDGGSDDGQYAEGRKGYVTCRFAARAPCKGLW